MNIFISKSIYATGKSTFTRLEIKHHKSSQNKSIAMNEPYYSNIQLEVGLTDEHQAEVTGFLWVLICSLKVIRKRPAMAWEQGSGQ